MGIKKINLSNGIWVEIRLKFGFIFLLFSYNLVIREID